MTSSSNDFEYEIVRFQCRCMPDPILSDIDLKIKWFGSELPLRVVILGRDGYDEWPHLTMSF